MDKTSNILLVSSTGDISVADDELNIQCTLVCPHEKKFLDVFFFSGASCSFLASHQTPPDIVIAFCSSNDDILLLSIVSVTGKDMTIIGKTQISTSHGDLGLKTQRVLALSCSPCGVLSYISETCIFYDLTITNMWQDESHTWVAYQMETNDSGPSISESQIGETLSLVQLSHMHALPFGGGISLLSLGSSLVLLAAMSGTPPSGISVLLWDMRYGVVLASQTVPIPSSLATSIKAGITISLLSADAGQILMTLCPANVPTTAPSTPQSCRSTVYVIPVDPNLKSTIAGAIGKAAATSVWLAPNPKAETPVDDPRSKLLIEMANYLRRNEPHKADEAFFTWVKEYSSTHAQSATISTPVRNYTVVNVLKVSDIISTNRMERHQKPFMVTVLSKSF